MQCGDHEHDFFVFVDFIEKTPGADSITPGVWIETTQLLDIGSEVRVLTQLRVDKIAKFLCDFGVAGANYTAEVLLKLVGFKNPVVIQQGALSGDELLLNPS
jgi:hypothetical protein